MRRPVPANHNACGKLLVRTAGVVVLAGPLVVGTMHGQQLIAQQPAASATPIAFEVASVKVNTSAGEVSRLQPQPDGGVRVTNMSFRELIEFAYRAQSFQIEGLPEWTGNTHYDIVAKGPVNGSSLPPSEPPALLLMLRSLLSERFGLQAHNAVRQLPIYRLVPLRADKRLGQKLTPTNLNCAPKVEASTPDGPSLSQPTNADLRRCGLQVGMGRLDAGGVPISELANALSWLVRRPVADGTGLNGLFDVEMRFGVEQTGTSLAASPADALDGISIFTAVQEQLGLKLEAARGPVAVIVIDHVEPAGPN